MLTKLFERSPLLEVVVKNLYWRLLVPAFSRQIEKIMAGRRRASALAAKGQESTEFDFGEVLGTLRSAGIVPGDILIVHSSMNELRGCGLDPKSIVRSLKDLVGDTGTLAMPAFPIIKGQPAGAALFDDKAFEPVLTYDVKRSPPWTGALPKALLAIDGAIRSLHPANSMVAWGPHAMAMMKENIAKPDATPCGQGSSWEYCWRNNAKIVALGVDLAHSLTMIHVAEDAFEAQWPVRNWYRRCTFKIINRGNSEVVNVRVRRHGWSIFYAERSFAADMMRFGVAQNYKVGPLRISVCSSTTLIDYLRTHPRSEYPYRIPLLRLCNWLLK